MSSGGVYSVLVETCTVLQLFHENENWEEFGKLCYIQLCGCVEEGMCLLMKGGREGGKMVC